MSDDAGREPMRLALLDVANIELRGCDSMNPVIVVGQRDGGRLIAYPHLRLRSGGGAFPYDVGPAQRALRHDDVDLFGICYGVWRGRSGALLAQPEGFPGRQAGVVTVIGRRGAVTASFYEIVWNDGGFAGLQPPCRMPVSPIGDLLADPGEEVVVRMSAWRRKTK